jgi:cell division septum initiation protein DivIVA
MGQETLEVQGTVQPDGSLVLDEKLNLPAGRVRVTVQTRKEAEKFDPARFLAMMERIWEDQKARGHVPRSREEIDAEISQLRDEAEEEMQAVERLHDECQRARQQSPEQAH